MTARLNGKTSTDVIASPAGPSEIAVELRMALTA